MLQDLYELREACWLNKTILTSLIPCFIWAGQVENEVQLVRGQVEKKFIIPHPCLLLSCMFDKTLPKCDQFYEERIHALEEQILSSR